MRWRSVAPVVVVLLALAGGARADGDEATPDPVAAAASAARAAHASGDESAVAAVAADERVDVWRVAEALLDAQDGDVARALAATAPGKDADALRAYLLKRSEGKPSTTVASIGARLDRGRGHHEARRYPDARAEYTRAVEEAESLGWRRGLSAALEGETKAALAANDMEAVRALAARQLSIDEAREDRLAQSRAHRRLGQAFLGMRKFAEARTACDRSLELARAAGDSEHEAQALEVLGTLHLTLRQADRAATCLRQALAIREQIHGDPGSLGATLINLGNALAHGGDLDAMIDVTRRGLALVLEAGNLEFAGIARSNLAQGYLRLGRRDEGLAMLAEARAGAEAAGNERSRAQCDMVLGTLLLGEGDWKGARDALRSAVGTFTELGDAPRTAQAALRLASAYEGLGDVELGVESARQAAETAARIRDERTRVQALVRLGVLLVRAVRPAEARPVLESALEGATTIHAEAEAAEALGALAQLGAESGDAPRGRVLAERSLALWEKLRNPYRCATTNLFLARLHLEVDRRDEAERAAQRALPQAVAARQPLLVARAHRIAAAVHRARGEFSKAIEALQAAAEAAAASADPDEVVRARVDLATTHVEAGELDVAAQEFARLRPLVVSKGRTTLLFEFLLREGELAERRQGVLAAIDVATEAVTVAESLGQADLIVSAYARRGLLRDDAGHYARALADLEHAAAIAEASDLPARHAAQLANLANIHNVLGDVEKGRELYERALAITERVGHDRYTATILMNLAALSADDPDTALALLERARALDEALGNAAGLAQVALSTGGVYAQAGQHEQALAQFERALAGFTELGDVARSGHALQGVAFAQAHLGHATEAMGAVARMQEAAARSGSASLTADAHLVEARLHVLAGDAPAAAAAARKGVALLPLLVGGLGQEQGAAARDRWSILIELGVLSGVQLGDPGEVFFFMESGRAGALLEALGGRERVATASIPADVRTQERAARDLLASAQRKLGAATAAGRLPGIRAARKELEAATDMVLEAVARVQRTAKLAANVAYPKAADLAEVQAALAPGEALVTYSVIESRASALVVTRAGARVVAPLAVPPLPDFGDPALVLGDAVGVLRAKLVEPLALEEAITRVLVSPAGPLVSVPFATLLGSREVVYVPSGTTYLTLQDQRARKGERILALGDPDYTSHGGGGTASYLGLLTPLPGTRAEAEAIGDVVLLGAKASETGLRAALATTSRWRAIHLACHGLVHTERPQTSALALSPSATDDGFLTIHEIFGMRFPSDLVVLSACETGRGKTYRAEGIVGFTQAFVLAGAPRVIVSLWKVDDKATSALMRRFYQLWRPRDGTAGIPAAAALRRAQAYVASQDGWGHPYYWAAWQLWGLPE